MQRDIVSVFEVLIRSQKPPVNMFDASHQSMERVIWHTWKAVGICLGLKAFKPLSFKVVLTFFLNSAALCWRLRQKCLLETSAHNDGMKLQKNFLQACALCSCICPHTSWHLIHLYGKETQKKLSLVSAVFGHLYLMQAAHCLSSLCPCICVQTPCFNGVLMNAEEAMLGCKHGALSSSAQLRVSHVMATQVQTVSRMQCG